MIGKAIKGKGARGLLEYLLNGERATIIGGTMAGQTPREMAAEIGAIRRLRPKLGKAILHLPLSAHPQDRPLSDQEWSDICHFVAHGLGYEGCPMKFIRHNDTDHEHVHLVICRINVQGQAVSDSNDYRRIEILLREVERRYHLHQVTQPGAGTSQKKNIKETEMNTPPDAEAVQPAQDPQADQAAAPAAGSWPEVDDIPVVSMTTVTQKNLSKSAADRQRRERKRALMSPQYHEAMQEAFAGKLRHIHQHAGGTVLYFDKPKALRDDGTRVTAHQMTEEEAAEMLVKVALVKGWTSVTFTGSPTFVKTAMVKALRVGLTVVPADLNQAGMLDEAKAQLCIDAVKVAGQVLTPSRLEAFREQRKQRGDLPADYLPPVPGGSHKRFN